MYKYENIESLVQLEHDESSAYRFSSHITDYSDSTYSIDIEDKVLVWDKNIGPVRSIICRAIVVLDDINAVKVQVSEEIHIKRDVVCTFSECVAQSIGSLRDYDNKRLTCRRIYAGELVCCKLDTKRVSNLSRLEIDNSKIDHIEDCRVVNITKSSVRTIASVETLIIKEGVELDYIAFIKDVLAYELDAISITNCDVSLLTFKGHTTIDDSVLMVVTSDHLLKTIKSKDK